MKHSIKLIFSRYITLFFFMFLLCRNVPSGVIDAWVHSSENIVEIHNLPAWPLFDWMTPLIGSRQRYQHHISKSGLAFSPFGKD